MSLESTFCFWFWFCAVCVCVCFCSRAKGKSNLSLNLSAMDSEQSLLPSNKFPSLRRQQHYLLLLLCLVLSRCCCRFAAAAADDNEGTCSKSSLVVVLETPTNTSNSYSIVGSNIALALQRRPDVDLYLLKLPNYMSSWKSHSGTALWGEKDGRILDQDIKRVHAGDEVTGKADLTIRVTIDFRPPTFPSPMLVLATSERGYLSNEAISGDVTLPEADWSNLKVVSSRSSRPSSWTPSLTTTLGVTSRRPPYSTLRTR